TVLRPDAYVYEYRLTFFSNMPRPPQSSPLFPYTTLFRSLLPIRRSRSCWLHREETLAHPFPGPADGPLEQLVWDCRPVEPAGRWVSRLRQGSGKESTMRGADTYILQYASLFLFVPEPATSKKTGALELHRRHS